VASWCGPPPLVLFLLLLLSFLAFVTAKNQSVV
jgi:hypothetical protein